MEDRKVLYVSPHQGSWMVHWQHQGSGQVFSLKTEAIKEARRMVANLPAGEVSQIRIQLAGGSFQTEWTYGRDPYPPRG